MINLLPLTKIIAAISVLYAALIALILFFIYDEKSGVTKGVMVAFSGATFLNLFLFVFTLYFNIKILYCQFSNNYVQTY